MAKNLPTEKKETTIPVEEDKTLVKKDEGLTESEKELVTKWRDRKRKTYLHFYFEMKDESFLEVVPKKIEGIDPRVIEELINAELYNITGIHDPTIARITIMETVQSMLLTSKEASLDEYAANSLLYFLQEMRPRDAFESMLALRMTSLHYMGMRELTKANSSKSMDSTNQHISRVTKLTRLWNEAMDRWEKHRKVADQTIIIEHVNVNSGAQAIIGSVSHGGEG